MKQRQRRTYPGLLFDRDGVDLKRILSASDIEVDLERNDWWMKSVKGKSSHHGPKLTVVVERTHDVGTDPAAVLLVVALVEPISGLNVTGSHDLNFDGAFGIEGIVEELRAGGVSTCQAC